jgi:HEPN domain-containing protein
MVDIPKAVLDMISNDPEVLAAFAYGSRVEGLSNKYSDLDVCIISSRRQGAIFVKTQDLEVDVESIPLNQLEEMIAIATNARLPDQFAISWCHRIITGISISDKQQVFERLRERMDMVAIRRNLVALYSGEASGFLEDSLGAFESKDFETALVTARLGVEMAALAYLCSVGIVNPKTRWIYRYLLKVRGSEGDELVRNFRTLERICVNSFEEIKAYVEKAAQFTNEVITQAQVSIQRGAL